MPLWCKNARMLNLANTGQWLSGQLLIAHRGVVNKRCGDNRRLLQIVGEDVLIDIHVRVRSPSVVLHEIPDELKAGQANRIKGIVIGRADTLDGQGRSTHV